MVRMNNYQKERFARHVIHDILNGKNIQDHEVLRKIGFKVYAIGKPIA